MPASILVLLGRDPEQPAVLAGDADGRPAVTTDEPDDLLVHLADQDHLGDLHGGPVGDALTVDELGRHPQLRHVPADLGAAAVHDHGFHAHESQQHDILGELLLQARRGHRRAAVLEHHRGAPEAADVGHGLEQGLHGLLVA